MEKRGRWWSTAAGLLRVAVVAAAVSSVVAGEVGRQMVPAMYVFGDSLVDVGNNDFLPPPAPRAPEPPCGIDLPPGVAGGGGRFTNGFNLADTIASGIRDEPAGVPLPDAGKTRRPQVRPRRRQLRLKLIRHPRLHWERDDQYGRTGEALAMAADGEVNGERIDYLLSR